jgi:hypothetical protein
MPPPRRIQAPSENRAILADPPPDALPALVEANRRRLDTANLRIGGLPLAEFRALFRQEVLGLAATPELTAPLDGPLLLAGHQPELSHPGVWVKHFALNGLARRVRGTPLNLIVDNDTLKTTALRLPVLADDPAQVHWRTLPFDVFDGEHSYEHRQVRDVETFHGLAQRAESLWATWGVVPLLPAVWPEIVTDPAPTIGGKFASVRRRWERRWGCVNLELPVSRLAQTDAFARFVRHLAHDWPRFREVYNRAVAEYRAARGIRSRNHPVPDLGPEEIPFWGPPSAEGRRARATVSDLSEPACLRPRALTLTLLARIGLGDFFIHGIGGGTYDEVTDAIIRGYFGLEPPAFQVLSATLHLPLPGFPCTPEKAAALARQERDLYWNPQRHLPAGTAADLVARHRQLEAARPSDTRGRRQRFQQFRALREQLRPVVDEQLAAVRSQRTRADQEVAANAILRRRDYAWVLYPEDVLRPFLQGFL